MKEFTFSCKVTVSAYTKVTASSLEEALAEAKNREVVIGGNGTGNYPEDNWIIEDADGSPEDIHEE